MLHSVAAISYMLGSGIILFAVRLTQGGSLTTRSSFPPPWAAPEYAAVQLGMSLAYSSVGRAGKMTVGPVAVPAAVGSIDEGLVVAADAAGTEMAAAAPPVEAVGLGVVAAGAVGRVFEAASGIVDLYAAAELGHRLAEPARRRQEEVEGTEMAVLAVADKPVESAETVAADGRFAETEADCIA
jgi:hypothetical protein